MAPLLTEEESAIDPYASLEVAADVSEKDIKRAYRKRSLKCHPDRNPTPEAALMFRQISLAQEMLLDVAKRKYIDTKLAADRLYKENYAKKNQKRKDLIDALNAREEEAKKAKVEQVRRRQQAVEEESIKDAGKKMVEEAQKRAAAAAANAEAARQSTSSKSTNDPSHSASTSNGSSARNGDAQPPISSADLTLLLSFPSTSTSTSITIEPTIRARYGPIAHLVITDPSSSAANGLEGGKKKKAKKGKKAVVEFEKGNWGGCWACWADHQDRNTDNDDGVQGEGTESQGIESGVKAKWAAGETPAWVAWAEKQRLQRQPASASAPTPTQASAPALARDNGQTPKANNDDTPNTFSVGSFGSAPDFSGGTTMADLLNQHARKQSQALSAKKRNEEFESMTLLRMRQMERERLAEQIRLEEEDD